MSRERAAVRIEWERFTSFEEARKTYGRRCCIYAQADPDGYAVRVGKASKGLMVRYRGGTTFALDAAMHGSKNLVFVAPVAPRMCTAVEDALIFEHRDILDYNNVGKKKAPAQTWDLLHRGNGPRFEARTKRPVPP